MSGAETSATFFNLTVTNTSHDPAFAGITVPDAIASGGSFGGLEARYGAKVQVVGGTFVGNDVAGVYLHEGATAPTLAGITISGSHAVAFSPGANMGDGLLVVGSTVGKLSAGTCNGNDRAGILLTTTEVLSASVTIQNVVASFNRFGFVLQGASTAAPVSWKTELTAQGNTTQDIVIAGELSVPNRPLATPPAPP